MIPRRLGPYTILEEIASRGFTVTYRAEQARLGRTVLLRALKPTVSPASPFAEELAREAAVLARLAHPGIVRLYDLVESKEAAFLVLEDRRGVALPKLLEAIKLTPDQAAAITLEVARALGHAHERGVVHRGIRPATLEVCLDGGMRIVEFATAQAPRLPSLPEPIEVGDATATAGDATVAFSAPERILGEAVDARADVWALGVLFYTLAAGAPPFGAASDKEIAHAVRSDAPAPIPDLPRAYERVLALCLAKGAEDRLADGNAVAAALEQALAQAEAPDAAVLVTRALSTAKLGDVVASPGAAAPRHRAATSAASRREPSVNRAARTLPFVLGLTLAGGFVLESARDPEAAATAPLAEGSPWGAPPSERGALRIVASPWADVYVDGEHVDTTPIGRPIPVRAGRHWVTLKHPAAPDEQRSIKVLAGQTVLVDVAMRVARPKPDAGRPNPEDSP